MKMFFLYRFISVFFSESIENQTRYQTHGTRRKTEKKAIILCSLPVIWLVTEQATFTMSHSLYKD